VADHDIRHAVRKAVRHIVMDDELTMLIGPATDGSMVEIGDLDLLGEDPSPSPPCRFDRSFIDSSTEVTTMSHTDHQIDRAAERFERLADDLDPAQAHVDDTTDLQAIAIAAETTRSDETRLREAVEVARAHGRSWNHIAVALGVSRQAARQRFTPSETRPVP
jgi:hypothetical protein